MHSSNGYKDPKRAKQDQCNVKTCGLKDLHQFLKVSPAHCGSHPGVAFEYGGVDEVQGVLFWEGDVENAEERDKAGVHLVAAAPCFPHGCDEAQVLQLLAVKLLPSVIHSTPVQQQLQEGYGLLGPVVVHLRENTLQTFMKYIKCILLKCVNIMFIILNKN